MSHGNEIDRLMESDPIELVNRLLAAESRATTAEQEVRRYEDFSNEVVASAGDEWDGDDNQETIAIRYVRHLEARATTAEQERDQAVELHRNMADQLWVVQVQRNDDRAALAEERALGDRLAACMEIRWGAPPNDDLYAVVVTADAPDALDAHRVARAALATEEP